MSAAGRPSARSRVQPVHHHLRLSERGRQAVQVRLRVPRPAESVLVSMPVWTPGSYLVREFARHLSALRAEQAGRDCPVERVAKNRWRIRCQGRGTLTLHYRMQAVDDSVRGSWVDNERAFLNGSSLCLLVDGRRAMPQRLTLADVPQGWRVLTTLPPRRGGGRCDWQVDDYDALIDHPIEAGRFDELAFEADGVPFAAAVTGAWPGWDAERVRADFRRVAQTVQRFWQPVTPAPPYQRYAVLLQLTESGYGGLEHRSSTALQARRADLPLPGQTGTDEGYVTLLGLFAHELFHAWHVKRMRPAELAEPDLDAETLTPLLWCFEGLTTYFEDLLVLRAGVAGLPRLLGAWSKLASSLAATPGRGVQSLADASREAWIKAYRPDAHSPNATVSYYVKGALLGLTLDVSLRLAGSSLDALMHALWRRTDGGPLCHADVDAALVELLGERQGRRLAGELQAWVHGTEELPLPRLLPRMGLQWQERPAPLARRLGLKLNESPLTGVRVQQVLAGGAAARGGLMPGDELLAVNGWRLRALAQAAQWLQDGQPLVFTVVRDERLQTVTVPAPDDGAFALVEVALAPRASETALARRRDWLGG